MPYSKTMILNLLLAVLGAVLIKITKAGVPELKRYKENPLRQVSAGIVIMLVLLGCSALRSGFYGKPLTTLAFIGYPFRTALKFVAWSFTVGISEELFFRCWLQKFIERISGSEWVGLMAATLVFGLSHCIFGFSLEHAVYTSLIGFVFGFVFIKWKGCTIYSLMIAHSLYDMIISTYSP